MPCYKFWTGQLIDNKVTFIDIDFYTRGQFHQCSTNDWGKWKHIGRFSVTWPYATGCGAIAVTLNIN